MHLAKRFSMNTATPHVSIVVPSRNERRHIAACLRSILAQEEPPGGLEVVIADGMSDDGTREIIRQIAESDERVRLIDNPQQITPTGLNAGIRAARGEIIVRMDAHSEYAPDYVRRCVEVLQRTGADNVGGPALINADGYVQRAVGAAFHSPFSTGGAGFHRPDYEGDVDTIHYGCWRRSTLIEIGLFDEELVRNQDDELNYRIKKRGGRLWQSTQIRSWYWPRASLVTLFKQYLQYGYWKVRVMQKHARPASLRHVAPVIFVVGISLGWVGGLLYSPLYAAYAAAVAAYCAASFAFSFRAASKAGWDLLPILPAVFAVFHVSYGGGFAAGFVNFCVLRRRRQSPTSNPTPIATTSDVETKRNDFTDQVPVDGRRAVAA